MMITRKGDTGKISQINKSRDQNFPFWKKYGTLHKKAVWYFHTQVADFRPHRHLLVKTNKCIKPQSSVQYLEHKREFGEPDLCLLNRTTILPWFTSEYDDSNTKIGQLVCLERLFQNYGIYWIDNRQLIYVRVWWLRSDDCSALFKLLSMSLVCQPSMLFHPLPFAYSHAPGTMHDHPYPSSCPHSYRRLFGFLHLLFCSITGYGILGWYL